MDVGCGEGLFLQTAQKKNWHIWGTEISGFAAKHASKQLGTDIYCGELSDGGFKEKGFDVVTMWHVLEHVKNPKQYLRTMRKIIKKNGVLIIAVPNVNNLLMQLAYLVFKGRKLKLFTIGEKEVHLFHFSVKTLTAYLREAGFEVRGIAPDFGTIFSPQQLMNYFSATLYYILGIKIFNAIEIVAAPTSRD